MNLFDVTAIHPECLVDGNLRVENFLTREILSLDWSLIRWDRARHKNPDPLFHWLATSETILPVMQAATLAPVQPRLENLPARSELRIQVESEIAMSADKFQLRLLYRSPSSLVVSVQHAGCDSSRPIALIDCFWWDEFWVSAAVVIVDALAPSQRQAANILCWVLENFSPPIPDSLAELEDSMKFAGIARCETRLGN